MRRVTDDVRHDKGLAAPQRRPSCLSMLGCTSRWVQIQLVKVKIGIEGIITFFSCCRGVIAMLTWWIPRIKKRKNKFLDLYYLNPTKFCLQTWSLFRQLKKICSSTHKPECCQTSFEQKPLRSWSRSLVKVSKNEIVCGLLAEVLECFHGCIAWRSQFSFFSSWVLRWSSLKTPLCIFYVLL